MPRSSYLPTVLAVLAVLAAAALASSFMMQPSSTMSRELIELSGPEATDCGLVKPGGDRSAAAACAQAALREGRPFRVLFQKKDPAGRPAAVALARKAGSPVMQVSYREEGWGGPHKLHPPQHWIEVEQCPSPSLSPADENPVRCE